MLCLKEIIVFDEVGIECHSYKKQDSKIDFVCIRRTLLVNQIIELYSKISHTYEQYNDLSSCRLLKSL